VTEGALKLQHAGLIEYARGRITVLDRAGLVERNCECYAVVKKEYDRLLPMELAGQRDRRATWGEFPSLQAPPYDQRTRSPRASGNRRSFRCRHWQLLPHAV
jgi:hypothetical protein